MSSYTTVLVECCGECPFCDQDAHRYTHLGKCEHPGADEDSRMLARVEKYHHAPPSRCPLREMPATVRVGQ